MVNLGCFDDWLNVPQNADDGDYLNYFNNTDPEHEAGIYYWNTRLVDQNGENNPDWSYLKVNPDKLYRDDILTELLGAINVQRPDGKEIHKAIIRTTDKELDRYYKKGLIKVVSHLDKQSIDDIPDNDLVYEASISWSAGLLYNYKTYDYTAKSFAQQTQRYVPFGDKLIASAKEILYPLSKNKDKNDINRSGAFADINGVIQ